MKLAQPKNEGGGTGYKVKGGRYKVKGLATNHWPLTTDLMTIVNCEL